MRGGFSHVQSTSLNLDPPRLKTASEVKQQVTNVATNEPNALR